MLLPGAPPPRRPRSVLVHHPHRGTAYGVPPHRQQARKTVKITRAQNTERAESQHPRGSVKLAGLEHVTVTSSNF